jgi:hypothetical protein
MVIDDQAGSMDFLQTTVGGVTDQSVRMGSELEPSWFGPRYWGQSPAVAEVRHNKVPTTARPDPAKTTRCLIGVIQSTDTQVLPDVKWCG